MTLTDVSTGRNGLDPGTPPEPEPRSSWLCGCHVERLRLHEDDARHVERCVLHDLLGVDPDRMRDDPRTAVASDILRRAVQVGAARVGAGMAPMTAVDRTAEDFGW